MQHLSIPFSCCSAHVSWENLTFTGECGWLIIHHCRVVREIVFVLEATVEDESATMGASFAAGALYDIGIFALLYSAYNLILNR